MKTGVARLSDSGELAYELHGEAHEGLPILLLRPLGGTMALWGEFRDLLAEKLRVISFDYRGSGRSSADPTWVSTRGLARDALGLLDHLGVRRAHAFGVSLGGMTATWLAILEPARIAKLCIASAPARGLSLTRAGLRRELAMAACFSRRGAEVEAALVERILSRAFRRAHPEEARRIEDLVRAEPASRVALMKHAIAGLLHDARRQLRTIEAPTLVLAGANDTLLGTDAPRALAEAIPRAQFEIIADAGHAVALEQPIVTATRVLGFMLS
ncbi:MAG TPA: alpha/beta fold hydrolase [Labilithrix sp.]|nr:alpha/beta fold hydrolase [Labilithrix sp.]